MFKQLCARATELQHTKHSACSRRRRHRCCRRRRCRCTSVIEFILISSLFFLCAQHTAHTAAAAATVAQSCRFICKKPCATNSPPRAYNQCIPSASEHVFEWQLCTRVRTYIIVKHLFAPFAALHYAYCVCASLVARQILLADAALATTTSYRRRGQYSCGDSLFICIHTYIVEIVARKSLTPTP